MRIRLATTIVGLAIAGGVLVTSPANGEISTERVRCGQTLNRSTRLANGLTCSGDGLIAGRSDIVIDLNGHRIAGDGGSTDRGVVIAPRGPSLTPTERVTVRGGIMHGFGTAIFIEKGAGSAVSDMTIQRSGTGVRLKESSGASVKSTGFFANGSGLFAQNGSKYRVIGNVMTGNGSGVSLSLVEDGVVRSNQISASSGGGIFITDESNRTLIERNTVTGNDYVGIEIASGRDTQIIENTIRGNNYFGIRLFYTTKPLVRRNIVKANQGFGIYVTETSDTRIIDNRVNSNGRDGIYAETNIVADGNVATDNGFADGISDGNGLGIFAYLESAGRNVASGNDDPTDCLPAHLC